MGKISVDLENIVISLFLSRKKNRQDKLSRCPLFLALVKRKTLLSFSISSVTILPQPSGELSSTTRISAFRNRAALDSADQGRNSFALVVGRRDNQRSLIPCSFWAYR